MYVKGLGQACDAGYTYDPSTQKCLSDADYTAGSMCVADSFPFLGTLGPQSTNFACQPFSPVIGYAAVGILALALLKGGRR